MTVIVSDTFTVGSDTALESHTPDTGTGWTAEITDTGITVKNLGDNITVDSNDPGRAYYSAQPNPSGSDYSVVLRVTHSGAASSGDNIGVFARAQSTGPFIDDDVYLLGIDVSVGDPFDLILEKRTSDSVSELGRSNGIVSDNDWIRFRLIGSRLLADTSSASKNGPWINRIDTTDSTHSTAGRWGVNAGALSTGGTDAGTDGDDFVTDDSPPLPISTSGAPIFF